jgi:hypothetical protein
LSDDLESDSLIELVANSEAVDAAVDLAEIGLDEFLDDGLLKDVPVLGTVIKLCKTGSGISGYLFTRKLFRFLKHFNEISEEQRREFAAKLDEDPKEKRKVQDHLLLVIERLDDIDKADLVAATFQGYLLGQANLAELRALLSAIDRCFISDLKHLVAADRPARYPADAAVRLSACGLLELRVIPSIPHEQAPNEYSTTQFGHHFRAVVLKQA